MRNERDHSFDLGDYVDQIPREEKDFFAGYVFSQLNHMIPQLQEHARLVAESPGQSVFVQLPKSEEKNGNSYLKLTPDTITKEQELVLGRFKYLVYLDRSDLVTQLIDSYKFGMPPDTDYDGTGRS